MNERQLSILAIGGHIGDAELTSGAVLAKYAKHGHRATFLALTPGEKGHPYLDAETYKKQKIEEARKTASLLGCETRWLDYPSGELPLNDEAKYKVCDVIREVKPNIIITHWKDSIHKDHTNTYYIVKDALYYAGRKQVERELPSHHVRHVYFAENWEDPHNFKPEVFIDIGETRDLWIEAMKLNEFARGEAPFNFNYVDYYSSLTRVRGEVSGLKYAQAFAVRPGALEQRLQFFPE